MYKLRVAALLLWLCAPFAHAENYLSPTEERVRLSLGFEYLSSTTNLRIDPSNGLTSGTPVNAEDTFGLDKHDFEPKFQLMVRVGERNRLRFDYFTLDRSAHATLAQTVVFRDVTLLPDDPVSSNLSMSALGIAYGYSFVHMEQFEVAATLGVNITDLSAQARVNTPTRNVDQKTDQAGPLPTLGLDATWVISKRFYIDGRAQYIRANIDDIDGSLGIYELNALYRLRPNIAFAVGYTMVRSNLESTKRSDAGEFDFNTKGPQVFVRVAF